MMKWLTGKKISLLMFLLLSGCIQNTSVLASDNKTLAAFLASDVKKVLDEINLRFSSSKKSSGLFLFEGLKGSTFKRVPRCVVQFDNAKDQSRIILHRLFENYKKFDRTSILPVLDSYVQLWRTCLSHNGS